MRALETECIDCGFRIGLEHCDDLRICEECASDRFKRRKFPYEDEPYDEEMKYNEGENQKGED